MSSAGVIVATGSIGLVDAALVRWLRGQRVAAHRLLVHGAQALYEPHVTKAHSEQFLTALSSVDGIVREAEELARYASSGASIVQWPEDSLLAYSMARICARTAHHGQMPAAAKLTTLNDLRERYGAWPGERQRVIGLVSGVFDLIHVGHVQLIQAAKLQVDVLVVLAMSGAAIRQQDKNAVGDRPIYDDADRAEVLSDLRAVDHLVMFNDIDCCLSLRSFCPDRFIKHNEDQRRGVVQAEARLVEEKGGKAIYLAHPRICSSTSIIQSIGQRACAGTPCREPDQGRT
jgi:D-beta-D-heptose 7-phosphate kinase/D-beta-D-heptose 1-phosphate adenosyltransferase